MGDLRGSATYLAYRAMGTALQRLPEPVAAAAAAMVGEAMSHRRSGGPLALRIRHLERVLASSSPQVRPDPAVVERWARRSYRAYARYWVEGARVPAAGAQIEQRMMIERGYEHLERGMAAGKGVVLVLPHVGSWEWGGAWLTSVGFPMTTVVERLEPPALFDWFVAQRQAMGLTIVPLGRESGGVVLKTLRSGGLVGLLCDRDIAGNGVEVDFFGETTTFPAGPATLALRTGACLMAAAVYSGPGRDHMAAITPPLDVARRGALRADVGRITQDIAGEFERLIRRAPEQWHLYQPNWPSDREPAGGRAGPARA